MGRANVVTRIQTRDSYIEDLFHSIPHTFFRPNFSGDIGVQRSNLSREVGVNGVN